MTLNTKKTASGLGKSLATPFEFVNDVRLVAAWDVVRQARRPFFFVSRMMLAGLISFQVVWMWSTLFRWRATANAGGDWAADYSPVELARQIQLINSSMNFIMAVGLILLCPVLTAGCIAGDRERKIWYDLANSPLSGWSIVMGKMVARLAAIVAWILVALPIWAILGLLGGLDPRQVGITFLAFFFYGWFYAAIGLLASVLTARTRDALGLATSMVVLLLSLPVIDDPIRLMFFNGRLDGFFEDFCNTMVIFNPVVVLSYEITGWSTLSTISFLSNANAVILAVTLSGPMLTVICGLLLRPMSRRMESRALTKDEGRTRDSAHAQRPDAFSRSDGNSLLALTWFAPMAIKERKTRSSSRAARLLKIILMTLGLGIGGYYLFEATASAFLEISEKGYFSTDQQRRNVLLAVVMGISAVTHLMLLYVLMLETAGRILAEKESDTWLTLLSTPLEGQEILAGKAVGALANWRLAIMFLLVSWLAAFACGAIGLFGLLLALVVWAVHTLMSIALGLRFGLTSQSYQSAALKSVGSWLILEFFIPFFALFILHEMTAGVQPTVIAVGVLALHQADFQEPAMPGLFLMGTITVFLQFIASVGLIEWAFRNFARLNNMTQPLADQYGPNP